MLRKEASLAPVQSSQIAWLTRRRGETSTAGRRTVPARPIRVESSRGPELMIAWSRIWIGFSPLVRWMISNACLTMRTVISFLPLFRLAKPFHLVTARSVGQKLGVSVFAGQIVGERNVVDRNVVGGPAAKELDGGHF